MPFTRRHQSHNHRNYRMGFSPCGFLIPPCHFDRSERSERSGGTCPEPVEGIWHTTAWVEVTVGLNSYQCDASSTIIRFSARHKELKSPVLRLSSNTPSPHIMSYSADANCQERGKQIPHTTGETVLCENGFYYCDLVPAEVTSKQS